MSFYSGENSSFGQANKSELGQKHEPKQAEVFSRENQAESRAESRVLAEVSWLLRAFNLPKEKISAAIILTRQKLLREQSVQNLENLSKEEISEFSRLVAAQVLQQNFGKPLVWNWKNLIGSWEDGKEALLEHLTEFDEFFHPHGKHILPAVLDNLLVQFGPNHRNLTLPHFIEVLLYQAEMI